MGIFDFLKTKDINEGISQFEQNDGAVLVSINIPLHEIDSITQIISNHAVPLFVYCQSGARSNQAVTALSKMGYTNVKNIGGINNYRGKVER